MGWIIHWPFHVSVTLLLSMVTAAMGSMMAPSFLEQGECASFFIMDNFNMDRYTGEWYTILSIPSSYVHIHSCNQYSIKRIKKRMQLMSLGLNEYGDRARQRAVLTKVKSEQGIHYETKSEGVPPVPYHIIASDYDSYACIYSCFGILSLRAELLWVLSREPTLEQEKIQFCLDEFSSKAVNISRLMPMEQGEQCTKIRGDPKKQSWLDDVTSQEDDDVTSHEDDDYYDDEGEDKVPDIFQEMAHDAAKEEKHIDEDNAVLTILDDPQANHRSNNNDDDNNDNSNGPNVKSFELQSHILISFVIVIYSIMLQR